MTFLAWMALGAILLLAIALASPHIQRLPISTAAIYLGFGLALGPAGFGVARIDIREAAPWLERVTEVALILSLFVGGLKLRLPVRHPAWRAAYVLAGPVMLFCILGIAGVLVAGFGLAAGPALLIAALLAPTDPVLAGAVSVNDAADHDRMRYGLSGEAGLNDGMAFPFVIFALLWMEHGGAGDWIPPWALQRLLWAVPAGLLAGYVIGRGFGRLAIALRVRHRDTMAPSDFLALGVIALAYVVTTAIGGWGFLAAFAAGVGLRRAETSIVSAQPQTAEGADAPHLHRPAEALIGGTVQEHELENPVVAAGVLVSEALSFGDTAERLLEVFLVLLVGILLPLHWDARALPLAAALFLVVRPIGTRLFLRGTPTRPSQQWLMGWFGIRGIGSLYYLSYAIVHDIPDGVAQDAAGLTISTVAISIIVHGALAQPVLGRYERAVARRRQNRDERSATAP